MNEPTSSLSVARVYLIALVVSSVIAALGEIVSRNWDRIFPRTDAAVNAVDDSNENPKKTPVAVSSPDGSTSTFGRWIELTKDVVYKAESDGFVAAYTGGNSPADEFVIDVGERIDRLPVRTRAGRYDGTVCPVSKGDYWRVRSFGEGSITVHWLPISSTRNVD